MAAGIVGLGLWVPDTIRENDAWPESFTREFHEHRAAQTARDFTHIEREAARPYNDLFKKHALPFEDDPFKGATRRFIADPDVPTVHGDALAGMRALEDAGNRRRGLLLCGACPARSRVWSCRERAGALRVVRSIASAEPHQRPGSAGITHFR
jgi:hypothetical protein